MSRSLPRWPRLAAWTTLAALLGAGVGPSAGNLRADPPPLINPDAQPAAAPAPTPPPASTTPAANAPAAANATTLNGSLVRHYDRFETDSEGGITFYGNPVSATLRYFDLEAQQMHASPQGVITATGDVQLTDEAMRVLSRKLQIDRDKENHAQINADELRFGKAPAYVDGTKLALTANGGELTNATIFFGEPDPYGLNIHAGSASLDPSDGSVVLHGATLRLGHVPLFYLPQYTQGREDQPPLSLQAHFGYRKDLGGYMQTTTFFTKDPVFQPGLLLDEYGSRGPLIGPAMRYDYLSDPDWWQWGKLESGFIRDEGDRGLDLLNNPIPENRFFLDWQHQGSIDGLVDINSSMSWWRDSNTLRDFRQSDWENNQLPDNYIEVSNRSENALTSAFARYNPNDFELIQQRLPEARLDYFASPVGSTGIYQEGSADYVQLIQSNFNGTPTLHSNRFDGYYGWRRPVNFSDWGTFTPVAGTRITRYMDTLGQQGDFTRMLGQVGFDADLRAVGQWDYDNPTWDINGLQHVIRPVTSYRYIPAAQQGQGLIPVIDQDLDSNYPPIFDLGDTRSVDSLHSQNILRYGVENILQTRDPGYGSRELATFNVYNDIHFQRAEGQEDFSDVWLGGSLDPVRWLRLESYDRFDPSAATNREVRSSIIVNDGDRWNASINVAVLQHQYDQYWLESQYRITERLRLYGRWRYDEHLGGLSEQFYGIRERFGESWDLEYGIAYYRGTGNQDGFGFNVKLVLLGD